MIQVDGLTKKYPGAVAVDGLTFSIDKGEIVGFLGPNGAGKTTTMRMLTAFLRPTGGRARVAGHDVATDPMAARRSIGYLPENVPLYEEMRVEEFLSYRARLKGVPRGALRSRVGEALDRCSLGDVRQRIIDQLSKGYRQRVGLAEALVHDPPILILDEPTIGLDPNQIRLVRGLIQDLGRDKTLILSSHILPEVEQVCGRIIIIDRGRIVAQDRTETLRRSLKGDAVVRVELRPRDDAEPLEPGAVREALELIEGVSGVEVESRGESLHARLDLESGRDPRGDVFQLAVERGWVLLELSQQAMTLEDVFVNLTTREEDGAAGNGQGGAG